MTAAKARAGAYVAAAVGFVAPGVTYLLTVDGNGITGTEWLHAGLIAMAAAGAGAGAVGAVVYATENRPKLQA